MKNKSVVTVIIAIVVCLALVLSFFLGRKSAEQEKQPAIPTATAQATTAIPTETPNPTITEELPSGPFPSLSVPEDAEEANQILDRFFDSYKVQRFVKTEGEEYTYYTYSIQLYTGSGDLHYVQVVIMSEENGSEIKEIFLEHTDDMLYFWFDGNYQPVIEEDVDFDGDKDVLILCGGYRFRYYQCYLNGGWYYEVMPAFTHILNPKIDTEKQIIRSSSHEGNVYQEGEIYKYIDGELVVTQRMRHYWDARGYGDDYGDSELWTVENLVDGELIVTDTFSEEGMTEAEKEALRETLKTFDSYYSLYSE